MKYIPFFLAVLWLTLWAASPAHSSCPKILGEPPAIQSGALASKKDMMELQIEVKSYIARGENILSCTESSMLHNIMLAKINAVAKEYNMALQKYRSSLASL